MVVRRWSSAKSAVKISNRLGSENQASGFRRNLLSVVISVGEQKENIGMSVFISSTEVPHYVSMMFTPFRISLTPGTIFYFLLVVIHWTDF